MGPYDQVSTLFYKRHSNAVENRPRRLKTILLMASPEATDAVYNGISLFLQGLHQYNNGKQGYKKCNLESDCPRLRATPKLKIGN